ECDVPRAPGEREHARTHERQAHQHQLPRLLDHRTSSFVSGIDISPGQLRTGQRYYATTRSGIHPLGGGCPLARLARTVVIVTATTAKSLISALLRCDRTTANVSVLGPTCSADRAPAAGSTRCAVEAGSVALRLFLHRRLELLDVLGRQLRAVHLD